MLKILWTVQTISIKLWVDFILSKSAIKHTKWSPKSMSSPSMSDSEKYSS